MLRSFFFSMSILFKLGISAHADEDEATLILLVLCHYYIPVVAAQDCFQLMRSKHSQELQSVCEVQMSNFIEKDRCDHFQHALM